ncbi:MAG: heat-shock protein Hsp20 [Nitrospinae bacterium CG11_big_fil_rev_8_21_14_0_20_45_15]|nr:MAG: heat-shock protein Hsp20 [Nitrospinae bacterium CG11_big_fil_rev_8_21_14_0_20_45_15]
MNVRELIPWNRDKENGVFKSDSNHPIVTLQKEMNRMFENFSKSFFDFPAMQNDMGLTQLISPKIDVVETEKEIKVTVELPGMEEKDINVNFAGDMLVIKGEKKSEKEEKKEDYCFTERSYGSFHRSIPISTAVDRDKVDAKLKNGVLKVTLPKTAEAQKETKKIKINCE